MASTRLNMCEEGLLWKAALGFLGPERLHQTVVDLWANANSRSRSTIEYLGSDVVGNAVLDVLRVAQISAGAVVPNRQIEPERLAMYSAHAEYLADELLNIIPVENMPRSLRGFRLTRVMGL